MASPGRRYLARKLFELTGLLPIGAFLVEHLYSNFQVVGPGGAQRFDHVVKELQTNPAILGAEIGMIGLPLLYHAGYGLFVASRSRPNNGSYGFLRNWLYLFQRVTGVLLFVYIGYHVWNTRLVPLLQPEHPLLQHADGQPLLSTAYMHDYLSGSHLGIPVAALYLVGVTCAVFHFSNGLFNLGYHWGLTVTPRSQRLWGFACGLLGLTLLGVGLASLRAFVNLQA